MLLGRFLAFKQNSEEYMYSSTLDLRALIELGLRMGSDACEDVSSYNANYIATKMCKVPTTKVMDNTYEDLEGPFLNFPETEKLKLLKGIQHSFSSTKEAHEYLKKYKIEAIFPTVEIANLAVGAIEDYIKVNNNKKMFEGLQIVYDTTQNGWTGATRTNLKKGVVSFNTACIDWKNTDKSAERGYNSNFHPSNNPKETFYHELAHWLHQRNNPINFHSIGDNYWIMSLIPLKFSSKYPDVYKLRKNFAKVSNYATTNPIEFVAEYITGRMNGQTYPKHIDELFEKFYNGTEQIKDAKGKTKTVIAKGEYPLKFPKAE